MQPGQPWQSSRQQRRGKAGSGRPGQGEQQRRRRPLVARAAALCPGPGLQSLESLPPSQPGQAGPALTQTRIQPPSSFDHVTKLGFDCWSLITPHKPHITRSLRCAHDPGDGHCVVSPDVPRALMSDHWPLEPVQCDWCRDQELAASQAGPAPPGLPAVAALLTAQPDSSSHQAPAPA